MYCPKCGTGNADDAIYCKKCGVLVEPEDETRVATRVEEETHVRHRQPELVRSYAPAKPRTVEDERPVAIGRQNGHDGDDDDRPESRIFSISPTVKFVMVGYLAAIVAAFVLVALISILLPSVGTAPAVILGLALLLIPGFYHLRKKLVRYTLTETMIQIDHGLVARTTKNIPLRRVQDVTVTATIMQRILGYGDIELDNASEDQQRIILDDIDSPKRYAELILKQMRRIDR